jgi:hypothetical protein
MSPADGNWDAVSRFMSDMRNASRLATYVDTVVDMYESGAWRRYADATGRIDVWREREFDYFLIACGADYTDVQRLLSWDKAKAVDLAAAMDKGEEPDGRRPLDQAAAEWRSPTGVPLAELASQQGWTKAGGALRPSPVPARARVRAKTGASMDENARRRRFEAISAKRRSEIERQVDRLLTEVPSEMEQRYLIDLIRGRISRVGSRTDP